MTTQIPANVLSSIAHARLFFNGEDFSAKRYREAKVAEARGVEVGATLCEQAAREAGISPHPTHPHYDLTGCPRHGNVQLAADLHARELATAEKEGLPASLAALPGGGVK